MVFKSFHLARQSLAKGFTHGYAGQSFDAGVSQNSPLASFQHDRLRKGPNTKKHAFSPTSTPSAVKQAVSLHEQQDSGLAAYYAAWQKYRVDDNKDWSQFQFRKLIEWTPQPAAPQNEADAANEKAVAEEEDVEQLPARAGVSRAYSTSQVDDCSKIVSDEQVEQIALAQVDEAIAQEVGKINAVKEVAQPAEQLLSPVEEAR